MAGGTMFTIVKPQRPWSELGVRVLIGTIIASVVLAILDGILKGELYNSTGTRGVLEMLAIWVVDFRYVAEQGILAATIFVVGARFIETRSILTIGFDRLDAARMVLKGPDQENIVWVGHRYGTPFEAEAVASVIGERLKESVA